MSAIGQAILHGKAVEKSRKLSQQTWVTSLQRNMGFLCPPATPVNKAGPGRAILQGKGIGPKSQLREEGRAIVLRVSEG